MSKEQVTFWSGKTCQNCIYRKDIECFRFPHVSQFGTWSLRPVVKKLVEVNETMKDIYTDACAEYKEKEPSTIKELPPRKYNSPMFRYYGGKKK